jgi:hexulose-6-phosphate isomerase
MRRRSFLKGTGAAAMAAGLGSLTDRVAASSSLASVEPAAPVSPAAPGAEGNGGRIYKSLKYGMIGAGSSILDKLRIAKEAGFDGVEMDSPNNLPAEEILKARDATGLTIDGVVDSVHWNESHRLSSPDAADRERGVRGLEQAIRDSKRYGGHSVLLVPGVVTETVTHDHVWERSIVEVRKVLPLAAELGIRILIENVWNGFCYKVVEMERYVDEIRSPWVGVHFDIGNIVKYEPSELWIRTLGPRIVKLDVKEWGQKNGFCRIGDGDVNWPEVRKALKEIRYTGWAAAEVSGGGPAELKDVAERMDRVLGIA